MARKKDKRKNRREEEDSEASFISDATRKSVIGILLIAIAVVLLLASFEKAGPAGAFLYRVLFSLLGIGYHLIPLILLIVGILFLLSHEKKFFSIVFVGMGAFVLSGLGLIDVIFPERAGFLGKTIGALEVPFGYSASLILLSALLIVSLLITLNASIKFRLPAFLRGDNDLPKRGEITEDDLIIAAGRAKAKEQMEDEEDEDEEEDEEDESRPARLAKKKGGVEDFVDLSKHKPSVKNYVPPPLSLLETSDEQPAPGDLRANAAIIQQTLDSFGISVEMGEISIGPKVTRYTLKPAQGVKINKITTLGQDLALALAAHPIRIEAPIPGMSLIGIEVPNKTAATVCLGNLLRYKEFHRAGNLAYPAGLDVGGEPVFTDIEKLPHLLIAGATGAGKSILVHSILISLLYKNSPEMLKLILIDPKRVELSVYEGIPHLISPVITQGKKSIAVFRWAISEMDRRYETLMQDGSRDIESYNKKHKDEKLPYIVIVIDEMADLMMSFGREVETYVVRLAQMARAVGLHLILATQRPSVEVITGLIKANIPGRIALKVASQIDSRTILDGGGAEKLLGKGDQLFVSPKYSKPARLQGTYVSEEELQAVIKFIIENNAELAPSELSDESQALQNAMQGSGGEKKNDVFDTYLEDEGADDLLQDAVEVVKKAKKASASLLQRRLKVGYARAARILDEMEEKGLIGPARGAKAREIYMLDGDEAGGNFDTEEDEDIDEEEFE